MQTELPFPLASAQSAPAGAAGNARSGIARLGYLHDAMIAAIVDNPTITHEELAQQIGYSEKWVCSTIASDAFGARLAKRKAEIQNSPVSLQSIDERLRAVATKSLDLILDHLTLAPVELQQAISTASMATKALGYGAGRQAVTVNTNFVVALPQKSSSASDWARKYGGSAS